MPEIAEIIIMSDFILKNSEDKVFNRVFDVQKGNNYFDITDSITNNQKFTIQTITNGKELTLSLIKEDKTKINLCFFMGMTGNWKVCETNIVSDTKFTRFRMDTTDGYSLICYGGYMGPKWNIGQFKGSKRGPDPILSHDLFKQNVLNNLEKKAFDKPIAECILNQEYFNGIGAYLTAEILGRMDINPFKKFNTFTESERCYLFEMILKCCNESYYYGGGEIKDWSNPFGKCRINEWLSFYGKKDICYKYKFGKRNIWINKKFLN